MEKKNKKKKSPETYVMDFGFYSYEIKVKARTKGEARKKAMEKLQKKSLRKLINPHTTYLDKL